MINLVFHLAYEVYFTGISLYKSVENYALFLYFAPLARLVSIVFPPYFILINI